MWDALKEVLTSGNAIYLLIFALIVIIIACILLKTGKLSINTKSIKIGASESTRHLLQAQLEYVRARFLETETVIPEGLDNYRTKWVISEACDIMSKAIVFNSMTTSDTYIESKAASIYACIISKTDNQYFRTNEFKEFVYKLVKDIIVNLVKMKNELS